MIVRKEAGSEEVLLEGVLGAPFYRIRELLYSQYAIV